MHMATNLKTVNGRHDDLWVTYVPLKPCHLSRVEGYDSYVRRPDTVLNHCVAHIRDTLGFFDVAQRCSTFGLATTYVQYNTWVLNWRRK